MNNRFEHNMLAMHNEKGQEWLSQLPERIQSVAKQYHLSQLTPVQNMSFNYVVSGYQNNRPIILKLGLDSVSLLNEVRCLNAFKEHAMPTVIASDSNMLIMERAIPGTTLKAYFPENDQDATRIVCDLIKKLHQASTQNISHFSNLKDVLKTLDNALDIPQSILTKARILRDELLSSTVQTVLLHGDLHHDNILKNGDEWWAIDPKGFIGDPVFELAAYLCNPMPELLQATNAKQIVLDRIRLFSEQLAFDISRIQDWLYVKSVLSWAWCLEDQLDVGYFKTFVETIAEPLLSRG